LRRHLQQGRHRAGNLSRGLIALALCGLAMGAERAAFDSDGRLIALLAPDGEELAVVGNVVAVLPVNGRRVQLQSRRDGPGLRREGELNSWSGGFTLPDGSRGRIALKAEDRTAGGIRYTASVTAESTLDVNGVELVLDVPRAQFLNGRVFPVPGGSPLVLGKSRPSLFQGETGGIWFEDSSAETTLAVRFEDSPKPVTLADRWDVAGRSWRIRVLMGKGLWESGRTATVTAVLEPGHKLVKPVPDAVISLNSSRTLFEFDGFGGNYCWDTRSAAAKYTLANLRIAWARTEMKLVQWDRNRANPPADVREDLELMKQFQAKKIPYAISIWWLPERFYTDPHEKPRSTHFRLIRGDRWEELLDTITAYLTWAKREYGVEPDLFSFNEANIGVYVGQTPEAHADALKKIGARFGAAGLKTRLMLGDATGPKDTHKFALTAAEDADVMRYVGAVSFHSWGGGTAEQYAAWGDLAEWLGLPLLVAELGVDAQAYQNRAYHNWHYGIREAAMTQELLTYARPRGTQFWQFTDDYGLVRSKPDGGVDLTPRFWLMKHFTDLTPAKSQALAVTSSDPRVLVTAFAGASGTVLHLLNPGPARTVALEGLADGPWEVTESSEPAQFVRRPLGAARRLDLPARSLVSLTGGRLR